MKIWQIIMVVTMLSLIAAGCSQPTQVNPIDPNPLPVENNTPNLGTQQNIPGSEENTQTQPGNVPKVSVQTFEAFGSRYNEKYTFNRLQINYTSTQALDMSKMTIIAKNKYFNGTLTYNSTVPCSDLVKVIKNRNKQFSGTEGTICFSAARDLNPQDTLDVIVNYEDKSIITENVKIPITSGQAYIRIK